MVFYYYFALSVFVLLFKTSSIWSKKKKEDTMVSLYVGRCMWIGVIDSKGMIPGEVRMKPGRDLVSQAGSNSVVRP